MVGYKVTGRFLNPHQGNMSGTETRWGPDTHTQDVHVNASNLLEATMRAETHFRKSYEGFAHIACAIECQMPEVIL